MYLSIKKEGRCTIVFEVWPGHHLGDKACYGRWASGSPRPLTVWRPPHAVRHRLGKEWRPPDT